MKDSIMIAVVVAVVVVVSYVVLTYPTHENTYVPKCPTNKVQTFT